MKLENCFTICMVKLLLLAHELGLGFFQCLLVGLLLLLERGIFLSGKSMEISGE
jgi:hypothetical protein